MRTAIAHRDTEARRRASLRVSVPLCEPGCSSHHTRPRAMETNPLSRDRVVQLLQEHRAEIDRFGVRSISIFGSVARDEARTGSDLDVMVDFGNDLTFDNYMGLKFFLEDLLAARVDVATPGTLHPRIERAVTKEFVRVA
ncbi:MAG: Nucleotidyltransferase domain protein, BT0168 group [uncultured Gemmatimonadetes bacterium]|uniref:Nucleotidyltransferase domain protein, BT0168 group n=1 Tax=uncultured Gemmatimonadota bacterium TaxID=203437 RepID=A0A6J4KLC4_9BACT|nr:MAG: Nucleotidyltransferase domain protein, BT0168 group [uncultured Gemmatimonadota bacterium]